MLDGTVRPKKGYIWPYLRYIFYIGAANIKLEHECTVKEIKGITRVRNEGKGDYFKDEAMNLSPLERE